MDVKTYTKTLKMEAINNPSQFSYGHIHVTHMFLGKDITSPFYGKIIGFFTADNREFKFYYNVHQPKSIYACLSNKMNNIEELVTTNFHGMVFKNTRPTDFAKKAFWLHTPDDMLEDDTDSFALRKVMRNITTYSRKHDLCRQFRKTDAAALKCNPIFSN